MPAAVNSASRVRVVPQTSSPAASHRFATRIPRAPQPTTKRRCGPPLRDHGRASGCGGVEGWCVIANYGESVKGGATARRAIQVSSMI